jgi:hypothetical protein
MTFQGPPMKLSEWNIGILNDLIQYRDIEGETFDFKSNELGELFKDVCAMANTSGGVLVLGVGETGERDARVFTKQGWEDREEASVKRKVGDQCARIEPPPVIEYGRLDDPEKKKFYVLLRVEPVITQRPYMIKNAGGCYLRMLNQSIPAGREQIINLCKLSIDRKVSVETLSISARMLKEVLTDLDEDAKKIIEGQGVEGSFLPEVDIEFFMRAATNAMWFLIEHDLVEKNWVTGPLRKHGLYSVINEFHKLRAMVRRFNGDFGSYRGKNLDKHYSYWKSIHYQEVEKYLEKVDTACDIYLE